jgi:hypothetical protein
MDGELNPEAHGVPVLVQVKAGKTAVFVRERLPVPLGIHVEQAGGDIGMTYVVELGPASGQLADSFWRKGTAETHKKGGLIQFRHCAPCRSGMAMFQAYISVFSQSRALAAIRERHKKKSMSSTNTPEKKFPERALPACGDRPAEVKWVTVKVRN